MITPRFSVLKDGYAHEDERLRARAVEYSAKRFESIQAKVARNFDTTVRIDNVHIFDPKTLTLSETSSVIFDGERISAIGTNMPAGKIADEIRIDGKGGTLVAGMYENARPYGPEQRAFKRGCRDYLGARYG